MTKEFEDGEEFTFPDEHDGQQGPEFDITDEEPQQKSQGASDGVEIEVVDDTPEEDRGRKPATTPIEEPTEEELAEHSKNVQKRMRELTRARHDERRRADKLARENAELIRYLEATKKQGTQMQDYITMGQKAYIEKAKQAAGFSVEAAKVNLKNAYDAGDSDAIAKAQEQLTAAQIELREANNYRPTPLQTQQTQGYNPRQEVRGPSAQPQLDDITADWVARNPWFQDEGTEDMRGYALGVHAKLHKEHGDKYVGTPEYFEEIDKAMRKVFPDRFEDTEKKTQAPKKPTSVVAPAQRSTRPKKIRLTRSQVDIANRLGISLEGYARQLAALENRDVNR